MTSSWRWVALLVWASCLSPFCARGQIDPVRRDLIQFGYNTAIEGHPPPGAYAFYYRNQPEFLRTNLTLRLALSPTYLDSELGLSQALGELTDVGIGLAGGAFADDYIDIRQGQYRPQESFNGFGGEFSSSLYHLFNPGQLIPLNGVLRGIAHFSTYAPTSDTDSNFKVPDDMWNLQVRAGLRWGGREPVLFPALAMELSVWYQGEFRTRTDTYGYNDRSIAAYPQLFWGEAFLAYTITNSPHSFFVNLTAGTSIDADQLSAYRLGGYLPMVSEFPLSLPGYFYQEFSARDFVLAGGNYTLALDRHRRWNVSALAATAVVDYLPGFEQPGNWLSGVGGGVFYTTPTWRVMVGYGYGIDAIRTGGRGASNIGFLLQFDLAPAKAAYFKPVPPGYWGGLQRFFRVFGS